GPKYVAASRNVRNEHLAPGAMTRRPENPTVPPVPWAGLTRDPPSSLPDAGARWQTRRGRLRSSARRAPGRCCCGGWPAETPRSDRLARVLLRQDQLRSLGCLLDIESSRGE